MGIVLWASFGFYYAIGFFMSLYVVDKNGAPPSLWYVPFIALVWPVLLIMSMD
jgi:hypothetical protein